jgi:hypothetical protein
MPSRLERAALTERSALLRLEQAEAGRLIRSYGTVWNRIQADSDALLAGSISRKTAEKRIRRTVEAWTVRAEQRIAAARASAQGQAEKGFVKMLKTQGIDPALHPVGPARLGSRSQRVGRSLRRLAKQTGKTVARMAVGRTRAGVNPLAGLRNMRQAAGSLLTRSLLSARTEAVYAYNDTLHRLMTANADRLGGWVWVSVCDENTCAACFAMHGSRHPVSERLNDHAGGRCIAAPFATGRPPVIEPGATRFAALSREQQIRILGTGRHALYEAGSLSLRPTGADSIIAWHKSEYGRSPRALPLRSLSTQLAPQTVSE